MELINKESFKFSLSASTNEHDHFFLLFTGTVFLKYSIKEILWNIHCRNAIILYMEAKLQNFKYNNSNVNKINWKNNQVR